MGIQPGESNYARAKVPYGVDLAAAWAWRLLVIAIAGYVVTLGISKFAVVVLPLVVGAAADARWSCRWSTPWSGCGCRAGSRR